MLGACLCIITFAAVKPQVGNSSEVIFWIGLDKIKHFLAFAFVTTLAIGSFRKATAYSVAFAALWSMLFGVALEGIQFLLPSRTFNPLDISSNAVGTLAAIMAWWLFRRIEDRK